ncbi:GHKL domain-containing protein [Lactiplantibacillus plantarum]|uniref:Three-component quorum-sensing regulatorysystem sensor histidine kinase n=1 Tax=Lactiplantibacillus plantarum TaxID=1590 RepID=A0A162GI08_LACPN|nr:GHKL domain-containing protein [Lactiplantibacillus plantarum]KZU94846.1 Three-component quorum-sensing regulatorysystem sensor histidine kinase [Lactiplantibacillus plantarum]MDV2577461.1 GHKL domain-containing protein [Lactiplantibacillus plantarum]WBF40512.1 GHKL domain-containing protein [Lactiplantibacillus plantarum]
MTIEIANTDFILSHGVTVAVRIIGNLLDNAIEQAQKMTDKIVTVAFNEIDNTAEIAISNPIDSDFNQHQIFETGYSTKGSNRGLGLTNVRDLVEQQKGFYMDIETKKNYVTMTLIVTEDK